MAELTKGEIFREAQETIKPFTNGVENRKKKLFQNATAILSFSVIALSIFLYAYNIGYCKVLNLPANVMSLDMTRLLPLVFQLLSIATFILLYISSLKADRTLNRNQFNFVRIIWGALIVTHFFSANNVPTVIGRWWNLLLICLIPVLVEAMIYWVKKPKNVPKVTEAKHQSVLEDTIQDSIFATYYIRCGIFAIVLPFVFAPMLGEFRANAEREYQICVHENTSYAVVVDYEDKVLVQSAEIEGNTLTIFTHSYCYFPKEGNSFSLCEFKNVDFIDVLAVNGQSPGENNTPPTEAKKYDENAEISNEETQPRESPEDREEDMSKAFGLLSRLWQNNAMGEVLIAVVTAVITYFFSTRKLKREQQIRFQNGISTKIDAALEKVREIAVEADMFEVYDDSVSCVKAKDATAFLNLVYYPSIMENTTTLNNFATKLSETRVNNDKYLDLVSVGYMDAIEKYLLNFAIYLNKNNLQNGCNTMGLLLIVDVKKWARNFDKHLTKRMNRPHYKLYTKSGLQWKLIRWHMRKRYLHNTVLNDLMKDAAECPIETISPK